jgi:hypothetical protein
MNKVAYCRYKLFFYFVVTDSSQDVNLIAIIGKKEADSRSLNNDFFESASFYSSNPLFLNTFLNASFTNSDL